MDGFSEEIWESHLGHQQMDGFSAEIWESTLISLPMWWRGTIKIQNQKQKHSSD